MIYQYTREYSNIILVYLDMGHQSSYNTLKTDKKYFCMQGYPQKMKLFVCFLIFKIPCNCKRVPFFAKSLYKPLHILSKAGNLNFNLGIVIILFSDRLYSFIPVYVPIHSSNFQKSEKAYYLFNLNHRNLYIQ